MWKSSGPNAKCSDAGEKAHGYHVFHGHVRDAHPTALLDPIYSRGVYSACADWGTCTHTYRCPGATVASVLVLRPNVLYGWRVESCTCVLSSNAMTIHLQMWTNVILHKNILIIKKETNGCGELDFYRLFFFLLNQFLLLLPHFSVGQVQQQFQVNPASQCKGRKDQWEYQQNLPKRKEL